MRKLLIAALLAGSFIVPAQAAVPVVMDFTADWTRYEFNGRPMDPPIITLLGERETKFVTDIDFDEDHQDYFTKVNCFGCWFGNMNGNQLWLELWFPAYSPFYTISVKFSDDLLGDFRNIATANFVSGHATVLLGCGHNGGECTREEGELSSFGMAVPEPATWAMMIGGFALAGAALRRKRYRVAFA